MATYETYSIGELQLEIQQLSESKSYALELLQEKLIRRGVAPEGTVIDPPRIYPLLVKKSAKIGDAIYLEGDVIEPHPLEALVLLREYPDVFEDVNDAN